MPVWGPIHRSTPPPALKRPSPDIPEIPPVTKGRHDEWFEPRKYRETFADTRKAFTAGCESPPHSVRRSPLGKISTLSSPPILILSPRDHSPPPPAFHAAERSLKLAAIGPANA